MAIFDNVFIEAGGVLNDRIEIDHKMSNSVKLIVILIILISISPRIPIGTLEYGRALELRLEDIFILSILYCWFLAKLAKKEKISIPDTPISKTLFVYLLFALFSSIIGILMGWVTLVRAFFFYAKEVQFFLLFFITATVVRKDYEIKAIVWTTLAMGFTNIAYSFYQLATGTFFGGYGIALIGEASPFQTGGYMVLIFCLAVSLYISGGIKNISLKLLLLTAAFGSIISIMFSASRAFSAGLLIAFFFLLLIKRSRAIIACTFALFAVLVVLYISPFVTSDLPLGASVVDRLTNRWLLGYSIDTRVELSYEPLLEATRSNPITGLGMSITGTGELSPEAHNSYLRVYAETGIVGLIIFMYLLFLILKMCVFSYRHHDDSITRAISLTCFLFTISLLIASLAQDAFTPVKVSELYWIVIGLAAVSYREAKKHSGNQNKAFVGDTHACLVDH